ncbi:MAG: hypothetical protein ACOVQC_05335 [Flavobacterium sp.]|jgi:hypothetical protein
MIRVYIFLSALFFIFGSETNKEQNLIVSYSAIACSCAQWKIENNNVDENIYLERADDKILDANKVWDGETLPLKFKVKGYFKKQLGVPKDYSSKGKLELGKVFIYSKIEKIK